MAPPNSDRSPPTTLDEATAMLAALAEWSLGLLPVRPQIDGVRTTSRGASATTGSVHGHRGVLLVLGDGTVAGADEQATAMFGYESASMAGNDLTSVLVLPAGETASQVLAALLRAERLGPFTGRRRDGRTFPVELTASRATLGDRPYHVVVAEDPAERLISQQALRKAEARFRGLIEQIPAVTFTASLDEGFNELYVSPQIEGMLGFTQEEWIADPVIWYRQLHVADRAAMVAEFVRGLTHGGNYRIDCRFHAKDGHVVWVHGEARVMHDPEGRPLFLQGVAFDISDIKRAEEAVKASLKEKEVLLKEIHHRVKNNLQVISSLLKLQSANVKDAEVLRMFQESQTRIRTMALVHEKLYKSGDQAHIDFGEYARSLGTMLFRAFGADPARVTLEIDAQSVSLPLDLAVPCGLVINEAIANSLKHAFVHRERGVIRLTFRSEEAWHDLTVEDDGRGLPPEFDPGTTGTLGMQLILTLASQLDGTVELRSDHGTTVHLRFPRRIA